MTSELLSAVVLTLASRGVQGTGVLRSLNYSLKDLEVTLSFSYSSEMLFDRSIFFKNQSVRRFGENRFCFLFMYRLRDFYRKLRFS